MILSFLKSVLITESFYHFRISTGNRRPAHRGGKTGRANSNRRAERGTGRSFCVEVRALIPAQSAAVGATFNREQLLQVFSA
jgi:hypothetical protein